LGTFPKWPDDVAGAAAGSPAWVDHVLYRGLPLAAKASLPVHPVELYEAGAALAIFAALVAVRRRRRFAGHAFVALVLIYGIARLLLESLRGDPERGLWGPLSASQWIALASFALVALGFRRLIRARHTALPG
jgi:phosphatidylglycerol---prolipoprotein diacylglyceryl transferase